MLDRPLVPVDGNLADWPRVVANAINFLLRRKVVTSFNGSTGDITYSGSGTTGGYTNRLEATVTTSGAQTYALASTATTGVLTINGLSQPSTLYTVGTSQLNIPAGVGLLTGDAIQLLY